VFQVALHGPKFDKGVNCDVELLIFVKKVF